jgi:hypothetical protein
MKGCLRKDFYSCATIFVDGSTDYGHVHLHLSTSGDQTLAAKHDFEHKAKSFGREIQSYHGDNGQLIENKYKEDMKQKQQSLTVCGIGAHHQSGIAEHQIPTLSKRAQSMLLHSFVCWPEAIFTHL